MDPYNLCACCWDCRLPATPSGCLKYHGRVRASRFYCHREDPVMIFRELANHSLIGCVVCGVVYKFYGGNGHRREHSAGNVAVGQKREQELTVEVE